MPTSRKRTGRKRPRRLADLTLEQCYELSTGKNGGEIIDRSEMRRASAFDSEQDRLSTWRSVRLEFMIDRSGVTKDLGWKKPWAETHLTPQLEDR